MGFWKNLRTILNKPDILDELQERLRDTEYDLDICIRRAETNDFLWESQLERAKEETGAYRAALLAVCPSLSSTEEMKQLYHTIAPHLDEYGFELYRAAKQLTGIDVCGEFSYEDNLGMFGEMDGNQRLRYLIAAHFHAMEWSVVPGTCHEKATLLAVDTTTLEYREFEQKLYSKVLERMGFQDILAPSREPVRDAVKDRQAEQMRGDAR